ncbi:MAG: co-chaperone GroES [Bdellovibrionaceae bacterium]|nr:co-chaperone GroES [Pseudobdellovibrionaceae bacterium]
MLSKAVPNGTSCTGNTTRKREASVAKAKKKAAPKKSAAKKSAKKTASVKTKKTAAKKPAPKKPKKTAAKTAATKKSAAKKPAVKTAVKKTALKKPAARTPSAKAAPKRPLLDLSDFVTPLDDRVIVQLAGQERMTAGGLYIPDTVSDVSGNLQGTIVAVGRGHRDQKGRLRPMDVRRGDRVVFSSHAGSKIKMQNEELIILREVELMGVVS